MSCLVRLVLSCLRLVFVLCVSGKGSAKGGRRWDEPDRLEAAHGRRELELPTMVGTRQDTRKGERGTLVLPGGGR